MHRHFKLGSPVPALLGSALLFASLLALLAWELLPYEKLERFTPEQQFLAWEGVVWMVALMFTFLGISIIVENVGWRLTEAWEELRRSLSVRGRDGRSAVVPWWMLAAGMVLMLIGTVVRLTLAP